MKFSHTEEAAKVDKQSKWTLIEAIAADAVENDLDIACVESQLAAKAALDSAGHEHADATVASLCQLARFDHEATRGQRRTFRTYGWSLVAELHRSGWSQEAAALFLAGKRKSKREVVAAIRGEASRVASDASYPQDASAFWGPWVNKLDKLLTDAAYADDFYGPGVELDGHSAFGKLLYERIVEKKIDAELRELLESEDAK